MSEDTQVTLPTRSQHDATQVIVVSMLKRMVGHFKANNFGNLERELRRSLKQWEEAKR